MSELKNACDDALKRVRNNFSWFPTNAHIRHNSIYRDQNYSNRSTYTPMYDWFLVGQAYSQQQRRDFMGGKLTSKSRSQEFGLGSYCKRSFNHHDLFPELKQNLLRHSYLILTSFQTLYSYFVEGDTIFVGRRKTFSKRVSLIYPANFLSSHLISLQIITERITISSRTLPVSSKLSFKPSSTNSPSYSLSINYVQSTSGGKSLLAKGRTSEAKEYSAFFDEKGVLAQEVFERWVGELVEAVIEGKGA